MRALAAFVIGALVVRGSVRAARRFAVVDRLPGRAARPTRLVPAGLVRRLARALDQAALEVGAVAALQLWLAAVAVAMILGFALEGSAAGGVVGAGTVLVGGPVALRSARGRRARLVAVAVPPSVERVASELRAGGTVATAVTGLAHGDGALAPDFARIDARVHLGAPLVDALRTWARERDAPGVSVVAGALAMCATVGGRSADALDALAMSLRDRLSVIAEARALSAQARMSALVVGGAPLVYIAWSALADGRALHALLATATGRACVAVGLGLEVVGIWWMRRIVRAGQFL